MNKTKAEIEQMASFICREKGQYMFNKKEIGIITGLCKDKVAELCENIPAACEKEKLTVEGAGHALSSSVAPALYWRTVEDFIAKYLDR